MNIASQIIEQRRQEFQTQMQTAKENAQSGTSTFEEELDASSTVTSVVNTTDSTAVSALQAQKESVYASLLANNNNVSLVNSMYQTDYANGYSTTSDGSDKWNIMERYNIPDVSRENESKYIDIITEMSDKYDVPVDLIQIVIQTESNFNSNAGSSAGAQGLMQLMPSTAAGLGVTDSYDPRQNIEAGTKLLSGQLDKYDGDLVLALAAYNAGSGNVSKYNGVPPFNETINYIDKITGIDVSGGYSM